MSACPSTAADAGTTGAPHRPLAGIRVVSIALNLPGPSALQRLCALGADGLKVEPPRTAGGLSADPMAQYCPAAYAALHEGVTVRTADLKQAAGKAQLDALLAGADLLLSSFRPQAMARLGLGPGGLRDRHPHLCHVAIVGAAGADAERPGHDLTYMAACGLVAQTDLPPTLYADMAGALLAVEAALAALLQRATTGAGVHRTVALEDAARHLALPRSWGLTRPEGPVGGGHAGYAVYPCADGRVAVAALEPHFASALAALVGLDCSADMRAPTTRTAVASFFARRTRAEVDALAAAHDLPLHTMPPASAID